MAVAASMGKYLLALTLQQLTLGAMVIVHDVVQRECIELQCPSQAIRANAEYVLRDRHGKAENCSICPQCTSNGFSVCLSIKEVEHRSRRDVPGCMCAHSVPATCDSRPGIRPNNASFSLHNVCYLSALQRPPKPSAVKQNESLLVTIEEFWLSDYWKELEPSNMTVFYEFPVQTNEECDGDLVEREGEDNICSGSLEIAIEGDQEKETETTDSSPDDYEKSQLFRNKEYDAYESDNDNEDDEVESGPAEVQFDLDVFGSANHVEVWYSMGLKRARQINGETLNEGEPFVDVSTRIESERLIFNLDNAKPHHEQETTTTTSSIDEGIAVHGQDEHGVTHEKSDETMDHLDNGSGEDKFDETIESTSASTTITDIPSSTITDSTVVDVVEDLNKSESEDPVDDFWEQQSRMLSAETWWLVRLLTVVLIITITVFLFSLCIYRKRHFCHSRKQLKSNGLSPLNGSQSGYQYQAATRQLITVPAERERLHQ